MGNIKKVKVNLKQERGITLIALIITIVILIILSTIAVGFVFGDNGIIKYTERGKELAEADSKEEGKELLQIENSVSNYIELYDEWDGTSKREPTIKDEKEIYIYSCAELKWLADKVNSGEKFTNYTIFLMKNLDLGAKVQNENWETEYNENFKWIPIGGYNNNAECYLDAIFEGNNHIVKGIYVNSEDKYNGLFGNASTIRNLTVKDSYINGKDGTAGIIGTLRSGEITNCTVENTKIIGEDYTGGIVGYSYGDRILNCKNSATINAGGRIGGIVGYGLGEVKESYNIGNITGGMYTAGIAGDSEKDIINCYNSGTITCCVAPPGGVLSAGIAGQAQGKVYNCYNIGEIITLVDISSIAWAGGIIGTCHEGADVYNCYNYGMITAKYYGGVIGRLYGNSNAHDCYYLEGTATKAVQNNVQGTISNMISKTKEEMNVENLLEWLNKEEKIWKKDTKRINQGYPILAWQE